VQYTTDLKKEIAVEDLQRISYRLSKKIIEITTKASSGHPSSSLSMIDILTALYFSGLMDYNPERPAWPDRDRFILSKGHGAPGLYVTLAEASFFDESLLPTLRQTDSPVEGHPNMRALPGVEASTGSLGQGLSIGIGHALAARLDGSGEMRTIWKHMVPSFFSHIIASLTLAVPGMILAETALSFLGLGLRPPVVSWGVLLQEAQNIRSVATAPWLLTPAIAVVVAVLALNFLGDGLRDAADPYN